MRPAYRHPTPWEAHARRCDRGRNPLSHLSVITASNGLTQPTATAVPASSLPRLAEATKRNAQI
jgi:hypothetical protein